MGHISKDFQKAGLKGFMYDFSVNYVTIDVSDNVNIHKYFMRKHSFA